jgi:hypothetical protein
MPAQRPSKHQFLTAPCRLLNCRLPENNYILLRSWVVPLNPTPNSEIQPRMFSVQHQQCVGDEYLRTAVLRTALPTIGRCPDPRFGLLNAPHRIQLS